MTRIDLHPEDLLDRAARGLASAADLSRIEQHLSECAVCRVEQALRQQVAVDTATLVDEKLLVARLTREVSARISTPKARHARPKSALLAAALVAACLAGAAAAATLVIAKRAPETSPSATPALSSPALRAPAPPSAEPPSVALAAPEEQLPAESAPPAPRAVTPTAPDPVSASELFSRANQARHDGKVTEAARLYRVLQERFSGSSEELVSRVSLGRLLLDRLGDSRGALVQFNSYLASPAGGALREEAMVGRALALGRLGRAAEERVAWQVLLDAWPKSTHRRRAQARLAELSPSGPGAVGAEPAPAGKGLGGRGQ